MQSVRDRTNLSLRVGCTYALAERRWHPGWVQARGPMLWVPCEPRCDFKLPIVRKSLRTPDWRQGWQRKGNAILDDGCSVAVAVDVGGGVVMVRRSKSSSQWWNCMRRKIEAITPTI